MTQAAAHPYLALGDSYTIGEAVPRKESWPLQLAGALEHRGLVIGDPQILARTGWTSSELLEAMQAETLTAGRRLVTLQIGVNNQYRGQSTQVYCAEFSVLLARAVTLADGCARRVLVVSIPDWGETAFARKQQRNALDVARQIDAFNAIACAQTAHAGAQWCDVTAISREHGAPLTADGLHPSGEQYRRWTDAILPLASDAWLAADVAK